MPTMERRRATAQGPASTPESQPENETARKVSLYEQTREDRIRENKERLQKLGIVELSEKLRSSTPRRTLQRRGPGVEKGRDAPVLPSVPTRRSSRLQNVTAVSYVEQPLKKKEASEDKGIVLEEGAKPEIYTEEHDKLLGSTERSWELFVDGYGKDGKRIYDPVKGKTCHQCRQKTLGYRTKCCKCNMVQGQFCGDCLYMRYGEHVLEALENLNWICPVCRGICNCSLCRQAKGWAPTGPLHRKVSRLGYKSVAHFLVQTRRAQTNEEETPNSVCHSSVKRSLPFSEIEDPETKETLECNDNETRTSDQKIEEEEMEDTPVHAKRSLPFSGKEAEEAADNEGNANTGQLEPKVEGTSMEHKTENEQEVRVIDKEKPAKPKRKCDINMEPNQDSIGGRLRQRRKMQNGNMNSSVKRSLPFSEIEEPETKEPLECDYNETRTSDQKIEEEEIEDTPVHAKRSLPFSGKEAEETADNKGNATTGQLELKVEGTSMEHKTENKQEVQVIIDKEKPAKPKRKCDINMEPNQGSIGGRLRRRRKMQNGNMDSAVEEKNSELKDSVNGSA